ncbi:hypothetical protein KCV87_06245 [Actinosynnema pretiosum subsp. pretiosum]|uniref:Uncharacterized protein n=2 Tax=Actinosynnema TaxID=40566 RepID=C6WP16_ACTMD|nr:hypothetical protein [Actinosynnema mirum]ACU36685.1 hypothetical protein Amir_2752 [Actinosynnema mirum DSM 43827]QUF05691.1 hypothetical protein KCV87_06245 [Actinosynnema pretiosum subsp. pretiosum]
MTGAEHYTRAQDCLTEADETSDAAVRGELLTRAQAHATLALAAATALGSESQGGQRDTAGHPAMANRDLKQWKAAAAVPERRTEPEAGTATTAG